MSAERERIIGDCLRTMHDRHGGLLVAREVWVEAKPPEHPLHPEFEWDDSTAADLYRDEQARSLIRNVRIVRESDEQIAAPIVSPRAYAHNPMKRTGYTHIDVLRTQPALARMALAESFNGARGQLERVRELAEQLGLLSELDGLVEHLNAVFSQARAAAV
jgi:hypothetical protein